MSEERINFESYKTWALEDQGTELFDDALVSALENKAVPLVTKRLKYFAVDAASCLDKVSSGFTYQANFSGFSRADFWPLDDQCHLAAFDVNAHFNLSPYGVKQDGAHTAVVTVMERYDLRGRAACRQLEATRNLLAHLDCGEDLSQRNFWRFYHKVQDVQPDFLMLDGQHRVAVVEAKTHGDHAAHFLEKAEAKAEASISAKIRDELKAFLQELLCLIEESENPSLVGIQEFLTTVIAKNVVIRIRFKRNCFSPNSPSTRRWVHSFMLWTGISPPAVVTQLFVPFMTSNASGDFCVYSRSHFVHNRRGCFDGWAFRSNGQGRSSSCSSFTRGPHPGRCERFRPPKNGWRRALHRRSSRKVGDQLRYGRTWS
jgi:hypothetical protein